MDINILLDKAKEQCGVQMEKDLAKRLGVSPQAVSNYRKGRALPDPVVSATLAGLTGVPLARVLGIVGEARAISREEKAVWRKLAATAMLLIFAVGIGGAPTAARASGFGANPECILCNDVGRTTHRPHQAPAASRAPSITAITLGFPSLAGRLRTRFRSIPRSWLHPS